MERQKRMMMIGRTSAGKTTLCQYLTQQDLKYHKTQTVNVIGGFIDTPGEYLERSYFRGTLMVTSCDADILLFVQDPTEGTTMFPPAYAANFTKPAIGIVTKSDIATEKQIEDAKKFLKMAGAREVFVTSSYEGTGFQELFEYLDRIWQGK